MPKAKQEAPVVLPMDAAAAVYRDRADTSRQGLKSEGAANFAAVTAAARAILNEQTPPVVETPE